MSPLPTGVASFLSSGIESSTRRGALRMRPAPAAGQWRPDDHLGREFRVSTMFPRAPRLDAARTAIRGRLDADTATRLMAHGAATGIDGSLTTIAALLRAGPAVAVSASGVERVH